jgi:hypothetical protein
MKKIFYILCLFAALVSCTNQDIAFEDYAFQGVYFPFQTPLRTVMLGDEVLGDNSIDLEHAFSIGASIGGMYANPKDRVLTIELAPELCTNLIDDDSGDPLEILPANYYDATFNQLVIPAGEFFGKVRVELTDAFFQDPLTTGLHYVVPVRLIDAPGDSILGGLKNEAVDIADPRISSDWLVTPKDYVLFGIKYINATHGVYLLRGRRVNTADPDDAHAYTMRFLDDNDMTKLRTISLTENLMPTIGGTFLEGSDAMYSMLLTFDEANKTVSASQTDGTTIVASGTGKYYSKDDAEAESYNGKKHRTIYLDYTFDDGGITYQVNDSLVFVDTDITFEVFKAGVNP